tara:strand:+ start:276 stop:446 length:171 start_codon:yes stop_codon:yes gene_type:complete
MDIEIYPSDEDDDVMHYIAYDDGLQINYSTNGIDKPHMLINEFEEFATRVFKDVRE